MTTNHQARELLAISQLLSDIALSLTPRNLGAIPKNIEGAAKRLEALALSTRPTGDVEGVAKALTGCADDQIWQDVPVESLRASLGDRGAIVGEIMAFMRAQAESWAPRAGTWAITEIADAIESGEYRKRGEDNG